MAATEVDEKTSDIKFNIRTVHDAFSASLLEDDDVGMDNYLIAYKELYKWVETCFLKLLYVMNICHCTRYVTWEPSDNFFLLLCRGNVMEGRIA